MFIIVDLPDPDAPVSATNSLRAICRAMPLSAASSLSPSR
jgi:hypothetical protein